MPRASPDRKAMVDARTSFLETAQDYTPLVAVDSQGGRYLVSTSDDGVGKSLFVRGARSEMRLLDRSLQVLGALGLDNGIRDGAFVDVGANIGTTTITAMHSHGFARAIACEPEPHNQQLLELNLVANGLEDRVEICRAAVGDRAETVQLRVERFRSGAHEVYFPGPPMRPERGNVLIDVKQVSLDSLASTGTLDPARVTLLWMDAQGHEGHVLRGASSLTKRGVPVVLELFPKGLERHGGLDALKEAAAGSYTHYVVLRHVRTKAEAGFILHPIEELADEIDRLLARASTTDVLFVHEPRSRPRQSDRPRRRPVDSGDRPPRKYPDRPVRDPSAASPSERESFLSTASAFTPLVAAEIEGATFVVRTAADAPERALFVERSHRQLELVTRALAELDKLGLGNDARSGMFVQAEAGVGIATVAALRLHGFSRALACEPDDSAYSVLRLNVTANGLRDRVRTVPASLAECGDVDPAGIGLLWIDEAQEPGALLDAAPPVICRASALSGLEATYTIRSLEGRSTGGTEYVLAVGSRTQRAPV